ncbi:MAG: hypothetical protein Q7S06_02790 [Nanoarchaeota archaeon]|nr:hypothetical protein [Nanoarchaeota archaeon]
MRIDITHLLSFQRTHPGNSTFNPLIQILSEHCINGRRHDTSEGTVEKDEAGTLKVYGICSTCKKAYIEKPTQEEKREYEQRMVEVTKQEFTTPERRVNLLV